MELRIRYNDGVLDVFDTSTFTKSEPFAGTSMLAEFVLDTKDIETEGLWLSAHWYDASSQDQQAGQSNEPVAIRKRGWKFLLSEPGEIESIESVSIDDRLMLQRVMGELVRVSVLDEVAAAWLPSPDAFGIAERIARLFDVLKARMAMEGADCAGIAAQCGCTYALVKQIQAMRTEENDKQEERAEQEEHESWMEGLINEDTD